MEFGMQTIHKVPLPRGRKAIQPYFGQINFLKRFVPYFAIINNPIAYILNKGHECKYNVQGKQVFYYIKHAISSAPNLVSLDYSKQFQVFSFDLVTPLQVFSFKRMRMGSIDSFFS
jgi:hypothetical protein